MEDRPGFDTGSESHRDPILHPSWHSLCARADADICSVCKSEYKSSTCKRTCKLHHPKLCTFAALQKRCGFHSVFVLHRDLLSLQVYARDLASAPSASLYIERANAELIERRCYPISMCRAWV